ncbi:hypothetical protein ADUPG1_000439, partial [Aduncisulcus paluster]
MAYATGLTELDLSRSDYTDNLIWDLSELSDLTSLSSLDISGSNMSVDNSHGLDYLPSSITFLTLANVDLIESPDFSALEDLVSLSMRENTASSPDSSSFPASLKNVDISGCTSFDLSSIPETIVEIYADGCDIAANADFTSFTALTTLSLNDNTEYDITESGLFPSPSSLTSFSANNTIISLLFHLVASMPNLTDLSLSNNNISDPSPLYALSSNTSWSSIDLSYNHICGGDNGDSEVQTFLASMFSLSAADVNASGQACECSSDDLGSTPLDVNKVCAETLPGVSNLWYVVCASDSYTSYTNTSTFACISLDNNDGTFGCSGGCEYGQECRYDSTSTSTLCQQVIVDENLHACVADMFVDSVGDPDYLHRTEDVPSLFSVASLRNLSTSSILSCPGDDISTFNGIEHLITLSSMDFTCSESTSVSTSLSLSPLSTLLSLDSLALSNCPHFADSISDLDGISSSLSELVIDNVTLSDSSVSAISLFSSLTKLSLHSCGLSEIPDLACGSSLLYLDIGGNSSISSLLPLFDSSVSNLIQLVADHNSI